MLTPLAVTITLTLYWGMIECCLGLFAACLPTIRFLFRGFSLESLVASVRSVLSLHSLHSRGTSEETPAPTLARKTKNEPDDSSMGSHVQIVPEVQKADVPLGQYSPTNRHGHEMV